MKKTLAISLCAMFILSSLVLAREAAKEPSPYSRQFRIETSDILDMDRSLEDEELLSTAQLDTFLLGLWTFDDGVFCMPDGWIGVDLTAQTGCYWHVDNLSDLAGGDFGRLVNLAGIQSLWCGARPDANDDILCSYATLPGYGNGWDQGWCLGCIEVPDTEEVVIDYLISWDTEAGYDHVYVEYAGKSTCDSLADIDVIPDDDWIVIASYDGIGGGSMSDTIPAGHGDAIRIRFRFESDKMASDEDGLRNTDGAVIIDNLTVTAENSGLIDSEDFEYNSGEGGENPGDTQTADGDWECCTLSGFGDFSGIYRGLIQLQEDPCKVELTCLWAFINGSEANYACGGHPEQPAVPFQNTRGQYIHNEIRSPEMDLIGTGCDVTLKFDVYRDLPLDNMMFYAWHVRSIAAGMCKSWRDHDYVYYGGQKDWFSFSVPIGDLIEPGAAKIQVALSVMDMCRHWCILYGTGACHSHSPLFDNVEVVRVAANGPQWSVRDIDLFQDTFPENGTSSGTGRIDMAADILPKSNPNILPGDSAVVTVSDWETGLATDAYTGFGPSVYFYLRRDPGPGMKPIATSKVEEDAFRWPLVDSVTVWGKQWYMFRMDTCFTQASRTGPVPDVYCIDINDHYFTNGDTLWFFFGAHNALNQWTWWSQFTGTVYSIREVTRHRFRMEGGFHSEMEMQILPGEGVANGGDILYVDNFSGRGAQPYFDTAFNMLGVGYEIDRFDKRGPSSMAGNSLGHHATAAQLHDSYRKILWNSGDLDKGTVGDGTREKADDYALLFAFLDQHPNQYGCGIYFSGDDLAEELNGMTAASSQQFKNVYMPHHLVTGNHYDFTRWVSPKGIGEGEGTGVPPSYGIFDNGLPMGVDTIVVFAGCPIINDFDVIAPVGSATLEMCYDPLHPNDDSNPAVIAFDTVNALGNRAAVVLSGFSYHYIRTDYPSPFSPWEDRMPHLSRICWYLGNIFPEVVDAKAGNLFVNSLAQNYPNPFNPNTTIRFSIKENAHVSLKIYNVAGRLVRTLEDGEMNAGAYTEIWNGRSNSGDPVSSGVYFYKIVTKNFSMTKKMVLLK